MIHKPSPSLLHRLHHDWRDNILTGLTVLLLIHVFVVSPLELRETLHVRPIAIMFTVVLALGMFTLARGLVPLALVFLFVCLLALSLWFEHTGSNDGTTIAMRGVAWILISLGIIWVVARAVYAPGDITYNRVIGAVLLYVTVGILFMAIYVVFAVLLPNSFLGISLKPRASLPADLIYFSFVTLTTVGYGDIVPVDPLVRSLSNLEAVFGQLFPATILARLVANQVSWHGKSKPKERS